MNSRSHSKHDFPIRLSLKGRNVVVRPLATDDRRQMVEFARALHEDDLLFLQRDITQGAEVDAWIEDDLEGRQLTLVAWEGNTLAGYATYERGRARWTRHVAELHVAVAEPAAGSAWAGCCWSWRSRWPWTRVPGKSSPA